MRGGVDWASIASKGANLAQKGFAMADDAGIEIPDNLTAPATVPPGMMTGLQTAMESAPAVPQAGLVDLAKTMTREDVEKVQRLADADAANRAAGGPGVLPGGRRTRGKPRRKTSKRKSKKRSTRRKH